MDPVSILQRKGNVNTNKPSVICTLCYLSLSVCYTYTNTDLSFGSPEISYLCVSWQQTRLQLYQHYLILRDLLE